MPWFDVAANQGTGIWKCLQHAIVIIAHSFFSLYFCWSGWSASPAFTHALLLLGMKYCFNIQCSAVYVQSWSTLACVRPSFPMSTLLQRLCNQHALLCWVQVNHWTYARLLPKAKLHARLLYWMIYFLFSYSIIRSRPEECTGSARWVFQACVCTEGLNIEVGGMGSVKSCSWIDNDMTSLMYC